MAVLTQLRARAAAAAARRSPELARIGRRARARARKAARETVTASRGLSHGAVNLLLTLYALALGAILGLGSADLATRGAYPFGGARIGVWTAFPRVGASDADPYIRAINARRGEIALAAGEGLALVATADAEGRRLDPTCTYRISGRTPPARAWTLTVTGNGEAAPAGRRTAFTSTEVLREASGRTVVTLSPEVQEGDWLPTPMGASRMALALRLYDTPAAANIGTLEPGLVPAVAREACRR